MSPTSTSRAGTKTAQNPVVRALLGTKLGMTQVWDTGGRIVPVTVIEAGPCVVTQIRTPATDGYSAIQVAYGAIDPRKTTKPLAGHFAKAGVTPRRHVAEFRTGDASEHTLGQELTVDVFEAGQVVDVVGTSRGKGFAGGMKRHGFHGLGASHGTHQKHRSPGAIGACATPARVFKGQKMAGRMGGDTVTTQNLTLHAIDTDRGLLLIKGAVPGAIGGLVTVHTAAKRGHLPSPSAEAGDSAGGAA